MAHFFRAPDRRQRFLLPVDMMDWLPELDFGQKFEWVSDRSRRQNTGCINFFTVTAKPRQQEKSPSHLLTPHVHLPRVIQIGQSRAESLLLNCGLALRLARFARVVFSVGAIVTA